MYQVFKIDSKKEDDEEGIPSNIYFTEFCGNFDFCETKAEELNRVEEMEDIWYVVAHKKAKPVDILKSSK